MAEGRVKCFASLPIIAALPGYMEVNGMAEMVRGGFWDLKLKEDL
jgi:hypothetical protein